MIAKKNIVGICGSASPNSANFAILRLIAELGQTYFDVTIWDDLAVLPHFKTELTDQNVPEKIVEFRNLIAHADGIIICTPEYVFSIPSGLKNALEWCFSTTVFSDKPVGLITASANGKKAHEQLKLIMKTLQAKFTGENTLLIQGVKGKVAKDGNIRDEKTATELRIFVPALDRSMPKRTP